MKHEDIASLKREARSMKLSYSSDSTPGYSRQKKGKDFIFLDAQGEKIKDQQELTRIRSLVLPPAWTDVWICPRANGHLQATGHDTRGRKQYKYHKDWSLHRNEHKHSHMLDFARSLPLIRERLNADLARTGFSKEKVVALAISVMDKTFIRVGNEVYARMYGSFGLTSLRNKHIKIEGNKMVIAFRGKKGVFQEITLTHSRLSRLLKKLKDIPGQELFQFYDTDGTKRSINSECINEYLESCTGQDFTAKDFRTWWGTVTAAGYLAQCEAFGSPTDAQRKIVDALDHVAEKLGNTRTVCKKYYVHPTLLADYAEGRLQQYLSETAAAASASDHFMNADEMLVMNFMEHLSKAA